MALQTKSVSTGDYAWKSWSNGYVISLTLTEESVNVGNNTSLVSYLFTISNTNNNRFYDNNNSWTISIGGHTIAISGFNFDLSENYTTQTIASGQVTVAHNTDGKKDMPYSVSVPNIQSWNKYGPPSMSLSGTWTLSPIATTPPAFTRVSIIDSNDNTFLLTNDRNCLVRYCSNAAISVSAEAYGGGQVTSLTATCGDGKKLSSTTGNLEGTLQGVGSGSFTMKVKDSAGKTTTLNKSLPLIEYVKLTCDVGSEKPDTAGNVTVFVSGNYFNGSFGATANSLSVQLRYKRKGTSWQDTEEEWQSIEPTLAGNGYTAQVELTGLDYQKAYTFQARAIDKLNTVQSATYTARATPVFDWGENDFRFNVPVLGITADMVSARYSANSGDFLLSELGVESGLLFIRDGGNLSNYYLGLFWGFKRNKTAATFHAICANTLDVATNIYGSVAAKNEEGDATYVVIPFTFL
ncbi:MAG: hypothetical protein IJA47_02640 [Oscillospiraceae bacterium]|nr:hypothetical protein [Oscillospiraceae bacterium]